MPGVLHASSAVKTLDAVQAIMHHAGVKVATSDLTVASCSHGDNCIHCPQ